MVHVTQQHPKLDDSLVGMTVSFPRLDLEAAAAEVVAAGYGGIEIFIGQLGPGVFDVPGEEAHAIAARAHLSRLGLDGVLLNAIDGTFDPLRKAQQSVDALAFYLRVADALGIPRVMIWDGVYDADAVVSLEDSPRQLAECIEAASAASGLTQPPVVSAELHPFTFALQNDLLESTAAALTGIGAGICLDVAHFAVAMGADFADRLSSTVMDAVNHVHWCDSDCHTDGFHLPPGAGTVNLAAVEAALAGQRVVLSFDLFGWPAPREAMRVHREEYKALIARHTVTLEPQS